METVDGVGTLHAGPSGGVQDTYGIESACFKRRVSRTPSPRRGPPHVRPATSSPRRHARCRHGRRHQDPERKPLYGRDLRRGIARPREPAPYRAPRARPVRSRCARCRFPQPAPQSSQQGRQASSSFSAHAAPGRLQIPPARPVNPERTVGFIRHPLEIKSPRAERPATHPLGRADLFIHHDRPLRRNAPDEILNVAPSSAAVLGRRSASASTLIGSSWLDEISARFGAGEIGAIAKRRSAASSRRPERRELEGRADNRGEAAERSGHELRQS